MVACRITESDRARFKKLWLDPDVTYAELLDAFGVSSHNTLYQAAARFDLPPPGKIGRKSPPRSLSGLDVAEIRRRYQAGDQVKVIAADHHVSETHIYRMVKRNAWRRAGKATANTARASGSGGKTGGPKIPTGARLDACSSLRRLEPDQIVAVAKSAGQYSKLETLAQKWGKTRIYLLACWHEYKAVT